MFPQVPINQNGIFSDNWKDISERKNGKGIFDKNIIEADFPVLVHNSIWNLPVRVYLFTVFALHESCGGGKAAAFQHPLFYERNFQVPALRGDFKRSVHVLLPDPASHEIRTASYDLRGSLHGRMDFPHAFEFQLSAEVREG
jgi:hypothetical protein